MICKKILNNKEYQYSFIENGNVQLIDKDENEIIVPYEVWVIDYYVIDKWRNKVG